MCRRASRGPCMLRAALFLSMPGIDWVAPSLAAPERCPTLSCCDGVPNEMILGSSDCTGAFAAAPGAAATAAAAPGPWSSRICSRPWPLEQSPLQQPSLAPGAAAPGAAATAAAAPGPWSSRHCKSRPWPLEQPPLQQPPLAPSAADPAAAHDAAPGPCAAVGGGYGGGGCGGDECACYPSPPPPPSSSPAAAAAAEGGWMCGSRGEWS
ncbi:unnamed protein product [Closterium sp. NIES-53]